MRKFVFARKRLGVVLFGALSLVMISSAPLRAEGEEADKPTANVTVDILSQYIWRGIAFSQNSAVFQPSMTASYKGLALNVWGNFDTDAKFQNNPSKGAKWTETDVTLSYSHEIYGGLSGTIGGIYYGYSLDSVMEASVDDSVEVYAGLSYAFPWLTVAVTGYREVSHYPGWVVQLDLSRNFKLPCWDMNIDVGTSFFYLNSSDNSAYPDPDNPDKAFNGLLSGQLAVALNIPVGKYLTVSPKVGYAFPLSSTSSDMIRNLSWDGVQNHVYGGLRIAAAF
jgi:uncharacterized protein (TIGR02001 family)